MTDGRFRYGVISLVLTLSLVVAGCGDTKDDAGNVGDNGRSCDTASPDDKCEAVAVQLGGALSLAKVDALAKELGGTPLAIWRTEAVCVTNVGEGGPGTTTGASGQQYSQFAYWKA